MAKLFFSCMIALQVLLNSVAAIPNDPYPFYRKIDLLPPAIGPDSVAFTQNNPDIAYVSITDGRVLKLYVKSGDFEDFAHTSPLRTKQLCDGNKDPNLAPTCGKVFGLSVDNVNQILYAVDVNLGLFMIQLPQGGLATPITDTAGGQPLKLSIGIDVDPGSGDVYFTDASQTLDYRNITPPISVLDSTARLIKYNPRTKEVTVLVSGLFFPSGPAVSFDGTFVLIPQIGAKNIIKYYIRGPKATTTEVLLTLPGSPYKIKRASTLGDFWVAINAPSSLNNTTGYKFDWLGRVLITKDLSQQYPNTSVNVIQETNPFTLFVASRGTAYITLYYY